MSGTHYEVEKSELEEWGRDRRDGHGHGPSWAASWTWGSSSPWLFWGSFLRAGTGQGWTLGQNRKGWAPGHFGMR